MERVLTAAEDYNNRLAQLGRLESAGVNCYPGVPPVVTHRNQGVIDNYDSLEGQAVSVVGRVRNWRSLGKIIFAPIEDQTGVVQVVISRNGIGDDDQFKLIRDNFSRGDWIATTGSLGKTKTGEISVFPGDVTMLNKALRAAPFKVEDPEIQQRQRYLQTLVDPQARDRFRT